MNISDSRSLPEITLVQYPTEYPIDKDNSFAGFFHPRRRARRENFFGFRANFIIIRAGGFLKRGFGNLLRVFFRIPLKDNTSLTNFQLPYSIISFNGYPVIMSYKNLLTNKEKFDSVTNIDVGSNLTELKIMNQISFYDSASIVSNLTSRSQFDTAYLSSSLCTTQHKIHNQVRKCTSRPNGYLQLSFALIALVLIAGPAEALTIRPSKNLAKLSPTERIYCEKIVSKIYIVEGTKSKHPYGILGYGKLTESQARKICLNTVVNSYTRFKAQSKEKNFFRFLGSTYCPPSAHPLNKNWVPNLTKLMSQTGVSYGG